MGNESSVFSDTEKERQKLRTDKDRPLPLSLTWRDTEEIIWKTFCPSSTDVVSGLGRGEDRGGGDRRTGYGKRKMR